MRVSLPDEPFNEKWSRDNQLNVVVAEQPKSFVSQQLGPLLQQEAHDWHHDGTPDFKVLNERDFWLRAADNLYSHVHLQGFFLTDWFPRTPGLYWTDDAKRARDGVYDGPYYNDPVLGEYYEPSAKMFLIERGGIGTIRLQPRLINGERCWYGSAAKGRFCDAGVPLAIPQRVLMSGGLPWGKSVDLDGHLLFFKEADLQELAASLQGVRPLVLFVERIRLSAEIPEGGPPSLRPVVLFERQDSGTYRRREPGYVFVQIRSGIDRDIDQASNWMIRYAEKFNGSVVTNFDEQRPLLADAPLSYQRLVSKEFDRTVAERYVSRTVIQRIKHLHIERLHMGDNINATGNATVINRSTITDSTLTIKSSPSLRPEQKSELTALVKSIDAELANVREMYKDEAKMVDNAVQNAVVQAAKPASERKKPFLELTANGLLQTAKLLVDVAPGVVQAASHLATFMTGLV